MTNKDFKEHAKVIMSAFAKDTNIHEFAKLSLENYEKLQEIHNIVHPYSDTPKTIADYKICRIQNLLGGDFSAK